MRTKGKEELEADDEGGEYEGKEKESGEEDIVED